MKNEKIIILWEAYDAFRKKRFSEAIILLEKIVLHNARDPYPSFLLCINYLLESRFSEADNTIKKIRTADLNYLPLIELESFLLLKSAPDIHTVIAAYIDRLGKYPKNKIFINAIKILRRIKNFNDFQKSAKLADFVSIPKPQISKSDYNNDYYEIPEKPERRINNYIIKSNHGKIKYIILFICILTAVSIIFYYLYINKKIIISISEKGNSPQIDSINIDLLQYDLIDKIIKVKPFVFYYSNDEIINDFNKAKLLIKNEKYNEALLYINKISNSNANYRVKERNDFLRKIISAIEFKKYSEIPIEQVFKEPYLYRGSFVKWKGKIANLKRKEKNFSFNLLVNYTKEDKFSGIIDVYSGKDYVNINNSDIVLIEGVFINTIGPGNRIYIVADNIKIEK